MTFRQVNVVVRDMEASVAFYRLCGMELAAAREWPDGSGWLHVGVEGDGVPDFDLDNEAFARVWAPEWKAPRGVVLGLSLPSAEAVDEAYRRVVDAGHAGLQPPYDAFFGSRYAMVQDPDGNPVGLMGPRDRARGYVPEVP